MTDRKQIETFHRHLDALLSGSEPDLSGLPENDRQALHLAARLADIDLSPQSVRRYRLRRKFLQIDRRPFNTTPGLAQRLSFHPSPALLIAFPGATLLFVLAFVLGWTFTNLGHLSAFDDPVTATAFAIPGASIESGLPPLADVPAAQAFAPQPLPTPIAPPQAVKYTPSTLGPNRTQPLTSRRSIPAGVTQASP